MNKIACFDVTSGVPFSFPSWTGGEVVDLGVSGARRFLSMPEDVFAQVPAQDPSIDFRLASADEIAAAKVSSARVQMINDGVVAKIRSKYTVDAEFQALRTQDAEYLSFVEAAVAEGKEAKASLGF